jgi:hypothetical protein
MKARLAAVAFAAMLCACGGGGGGDGGGSSASAPYHLGFDKSTLQVTTGQGVPRQVDITATIDRAIPEAVNLAIIDRDGVLEPTIALTPLSQTSYRATLTTRAALAPGHYQGTLEIRLCHDAPLTCASPVAGSPWTIAVRHHRHRRERPCTVAAPAPSPAPAPAPAPAPSPAPAPPPGYLASFEPASVTVNDYLGELPPVPVAVTLTPTNGAGAVYPRLVDPAGVFDPNPPTTMNGASVSATLYVGTTTPGMYQGNVELHLCKDLPCTAEYAGSPTLLPYSVKVMAASNLTPLVPMGGAGEWAMHQANAAHTGYVPVTLDAARFNRRWRWVTTSGWASTCRPPSPPMARCTWSPAATSAAATTWWR